MRIHLIATTATLWLFTACGPKAEPSSEPADRQTWNTDSGDTDTGDPADTETVDSDTVDSDTVVDTDIFAVGDGGYITAGPWHGYSWTRISGRWCFHRPDDIHRPRTGERPAVRQRHRGRHGQLERQRPHRIQPEPG